MHAIRAGRIQLPAVVLSALLAVLWLVAACGSDADSQDPVRPVRLPPTTISEGEPPPKIQEPPRPVDPLPPPEPDQP